MATKAEVLSFMQHTCMEHRCICVPGIVPSAENAEQAQGPCSRGAYLHASGVDGNKPVNKETRSFWMMTGAIYTKNKAESRDERRLTGQSGPSAI